MHGWCVHTVVNLTGIPWGKAEADPEGLVGGEECGPRERGLGKRKGKEEYLYSAFLAKVVHSKRSGMDHTVSPANNTMPAFPS